MKANLYLYGQFRATICIPDGTRVQRILHRQFARGADHLDELKKPPACRLPFFLTPHAKGGPCHES